MTTHETQREAAQALSWGLAFGVIDLRHVISWADAQIVAATEAPMWLIDLSLVRDRNAAISQLDALSEGHDFALAVGLFAVLADDAISRLPEFWRKGLSGLIAVLRVHYDWPDANDAALELFVVEEEVDDGYGTSDEARAAIARFAAPYRPQAIRLGILDAGT